MWLQTVESALRKRLARIAPVEGQKVKRLRSSSRKTCLTILSLADVVVWVLHSFSVLSVIISWILIGTLRWALYSPNLPVMPSRSASLDEPLGQQFQNQFVHLIRIYLFMNMIQNWEVKVYSALPTLITSTVRYQCTLSQPPKSWTSFLPYTSWRLAITNKPWQLDIDVKYEV